MTTYGVTTEDIEAVATVLDQLFGTPHEKRDSLYRGEYCLWEGNNAKVILQRNWVPEEDTPLVDAAYRLLLEVVESNAEISRRLQQLVGTKFSVDLIAK